MILDKNTNKSITNTNIHVFLLINVVNVINNIQIIHYQEHKP